MQAESIRNLHTKMCPKITSTTIELPTQVSCDGVSECRSTNISLDVYSTRIIGCKQIYPHRIVRPIEKTYKDDSDHLDLLLMDLRDNDFRVKHYIADNLKRAVGKRCLNHASTFPCEYCFCQGTKWQPKTKNVSELKKKINVQKKLISDKIEMLQNTQGSSKAELKTLQNIAKELMEEEKNGPKNNTKIVWPASSRDGEPRTNQKMQEIIIQIEENPDLTKSERKGVVGRSPLWDIPHFDFVRDSPTEYMHSVCIGVVKRMIILTFNVGELRQRVTKRKLSSPVQFNILMIETKVFKELSRRARKLDLSVMKAQELRNIILFFFPHVLQCIEPSAKERRLWLLLTYMIRSCIVSTQEFRLIDLNMIDLACKEFYELYEQLFGIYNCSYNTHVVGSHLIEMRAHGPLTLTSAFGFEGFYGEMRHAFAPGTQSTLKQIFENTLIKRAISFHCCENSIYFSEKDTPLECNSLIYCFDGNDHKMYKIISVQENSLICYKQGKFNTSFKETQQFQLNWSQIGVYKKGGIMETPITIPKNSVSGKVIHVGEYLITSPNAILREK